MGLREPTWGNWALVPAVVSSRGVFAVAEGGSVFSRQPWGHGSGTLLLWAQVGHSLALGQAEVCTHLSPHSLPWASYCRVRTREGPDPNSSEPPLCWDGSDRLLLPAPVTLQDGSASPHCEPSSLSPHPPSQTQSHICMVASVSLNVTPRARLGQHHTEKKKGRVGGGE